MKSILFIAPSEQVAVRAETVIARRNMSDVEVKLGSFEKARKIVAEAIGLGTKIVVSRGGTASDLRKIFDIPMAVLGYLTPKEKRARLEEFGMVNCAI